MYIAKIMKELLLQSTIISLFCVGLRIVSSKGMILYFLRKPFEKLTGWKQYIMKPLILCVTCYASFWTLVISHFYFTINQWTLLIIFVVACLNSIIMAIFENLNK